MCVEVINGMADTIAKLEEELSRYEWRGCNEPPDTERNVFIAHGTDNMKSVCIGHYMHDLKQWYEDRNFFAIPIYDGMYWCEIPKFPTMKGAE